MKYFKTTAGVIVFSLMFIPFISFAQSGQKGIHEPGTGIENPELKEAGQGTGQGNKVQGKGVNQASDKATQRRSRVANATQQMLQVAERNQGVGQQIKTIAQNQNQNQKEIEMTLEYVKNNRGKAVWRFIFGPNKYIYMAEGKLAYHAEKLEELKELASQVENEADAEILEEQIEVMEQAKIELAEEIKEESKGFSLFDWLRKLL